MKNNNDGRDTTIQQQGREFKAAQERKRTTKTIAEERNNFSG